MTTTEIALPALQIEGLALEIKGTSPLICNRGQSADDGRFHANLYPNPAGGYGFPVSSILRAALRSCRYVDGLNVDQVRGMIHVKGDLAPITGEPMERPDGLPAFPNWSTSLDIQFNAAVLTADQVTGLFTLAGFAQGIGYQRPEKGGSSGTFEVIRQTA